MCGNNFLYSDQLGSYNKKFNKIILLFLVILILSLINYFKGKCTNLYAHVRFLVGNCQI